MFGATTEAASCCLFSCVTLRHASLHASFVVQTLVCCCCQCRSDPCVAQHELHVCCADPATSMQMQSAVSTTAKRKPAAAKVKHRYELPKEPVKV